MESTQIYSRPVRMGGYVLLAVLSREFSQWESGEQPVSPVVLQAAEWVRLTYLPGTELSLTIDLTQGVEA